MYIKEIIRYSKILYYVCKELANSIDLNFAVIIFGCDDSYGEIDGDGNKICGIYYTFGGVWVIDVVMEEMIVIMEEKWYWLWRKMW